MDCWGGGATGLREVIGQLRAAAVAFKKSPMYRQIVEPLRPSVQPKSASACVNAERRAFCAGSFSSPAMSTPMRRTRYGCALERISARPDGQLVHQATAASVRAKAGLAVESQRCRQRVQHATHHRHLISRSRVTAALSGFFLLSQSRDRPDRYREPARFETMPSCPSLHTCSKTVAASPSM